MLIKNVFKTYNLSEFQDILNKIKEYNGDYSIIIENYIIELIVLKVLEFNSLLVISENNAHSYKTEFTKGLWSKELDLESIFFNLYNIKSVVRSLHFKSIVKETTINYNNECLLPLLIKYFKHKYMFKNIYNKKELKKIENTIIQLK